jgi:predicted ATP-dependent protease
MHDYALFIANYCRTEGLLPFHKSGVAALLEHAARMAEDQLKLSAQFMELADFIREISYWATKSGRTIVSGDDVRAAAKETIYRFNRIEERMQELYEDGTIMVSTSGEVAGQINGLSVLSLGDHTFGRPTRITAKVYAGQDGMVNIEREVKLSGPIHDNGVLILTGYLGGTFASDRPLSLSASICFEQSYDGIEGDSASSTELYALISALSGVAINQGIAVTGSVNQRGMIQAIGGVNHKIEGFFAVCQAQGLTGQQGVMIPKSNEHHLMLHNDVIQAVKSGLFHIWSVSTIEQGIEILTGIKAGHRGKNGKFPKGSVYHLVDARLQAIADRMKDQKQKPKAGKRSVSKD